MRFVIRDTITIQRQILNMAPSLQEEAIQKRLLDAFKKIFDSTTPMSTYGEVLSMMFSPGGPKEVYQEAIETLAKENALIICKETLEKAYRQFWEAKHLLNLDEVGFGLLLGNPENKTIKFNEGYMGIGYVAGSILLVFWPSENSGPKLPAAVAHEFSHQMRLSYEPWRNDLTLAEYLAIEGLAEYFAGFLCGEELLRSWVTQITEKEAHRYGKTIKRALSVTGYNQIMGYISGEEMMGFENDKPDTPYGAGLAVGYHLVKAYLEKTGKSIVEATFTSAKEIIEQSGFFD
ncbi:MAG: DUF2268 domain-containing protein [Firmicutes bacterium]|nr:DUF2268 domain-containing protein [Bacillota bacterium]